MSSDFALQVYFYSLQVPLGKVTTYKCLAEALGNPGATRAVGKVLSINPFAPWVPCHRIVASDGKISGFFGTTAPESVQRKLTLLTNEGVLVSSSGRIPLGKYLFNTFQPAGQPITKDLINQEVNMRTNQQL